MGSIGTSTAVLPPQATPAAAPAAAPAASATPAQATTPPAATPATAATPVEGAAKGTELLKPPSAAGNRASAVSPEALKEGMFEGNRTIVAETLKERAGFVRGLLRIKGLPATFRERLETTQSELAPQVQRATAIQKLTNVAWAAGGREEIVKALDTAPIEVVPDAQLQADAAFDESRHVIMIRDSLVKEIDGEIENLAKEKVVDRLTGEVLDADKLKQTKQYHNLTVLQAMLGAHEVGHMEAGQAGHNVDAVDLLHDDVDRLYAAGDQAEMTAAELGLVKEYLSAYEYDSYHRQELFQWEMGAAPEKSRWMTIDNTGRPLDRAKAVENIYQFVSKKTKAYEVPDVLAVYDGYLQEKYGVSLAGIRHPGIRHPGAELEGIRHPGIRHPGAELDGIRHPGIRHPGLELSGIRHPGIRHPGMELEGIRHPGIRHPGIRHPGIRHPGIELEGIRHPGIRHPGIRHPGIELN